MKLTSRKLEGWGYCGAARHRKGSLLCVKNCVMLTSTVFSRPY